MKIYGSQGGRSERTADQKGFTLVELIVVLVILAILAAILVPALLGWIDKAKEKQGLLECRSVVQASQACLSELYAAEKEPQTQELQRQINKTEQVQKITVLADVKGTVTANSIKVNDKFQISYLEYKTAGGVYFIYDITGDPVYQVGDGTNHYTKDAPGYYQQALDIEDYSQNRYLDDKGALKQEYKGYFSSVYEMKANASRRIQVAYMEEHGSFNEVDWGQINLPDGMKWQNGTTSNAVWKPIVTKEGEIILVADTQGQVGNAQGSVVYYDGNYYFHRHSAARPDYVSVVAISDKGFSVDTLKDGSVWAEYGN